MRPVRHHDVDGDHAVLDALRVVLDGVAHAVTKKLSAMDQREPAFLSSSNHALRARTGIEGVPPGPARPALYNA